MTEHCRETRSEGLIVARRLQAQLDRLDEAVAALRATRLRQLADARSGRLGPGERGSPAPGR